MSDPTTPFEVERELLELNNHISNAPKIIREYHDRLKEARAEHRIAYAKAYLMADGTQPEKKAQAELATEDQRVALDQAEIEYKFVQDTLQALKAK